MMWALFMFFAVFGLIVWLAPGSGWTRAFGAFAYAVCAFCAIGEIVGWNAGGRLYGIWLGAMVAFGVITALYAGAARLARRENSASAQD